jgi:hypothetical protein
MKSDRTPESIWNLPDERFFREGGCHAFALELYTAFERAGRNAEYCYLASKEHEYIAEHVLVDSDGRFFDVSLGPQSAADVIDRWRAKTEAVIRKVEHVGWISRPSEYSSMHSFLRLDIEPSWLNRARERAREYIDKNASIYGLQKSSTQQSSSALRREHG